MQQRKLSTKQKKPSTEWEKIFAIYRSYKGLISKIYKEPIQCNIKKAIWVKKWAEDLNRCFFFFKKGIDGQQTYEKMLSITNKGLASLIRGKQIKTSMKYHLSEWLFSKRQQITSDDKDIEKREPSLHCWWSCKFVKPLWKMGSSSKN